MPKKPIILTDKNKQKEVLSQFADIINKRYKEKGIKKEISVDDLIKNLDNKKNLDVYEKCREEIEYLNKLKDYTRDLEKRLNIKTDNGYVRHNFSFCKIPEGSEQEKKKIEETNIKKLLQASKKGNPSQKRKDDLKRLYDCDKTKFFPKDTLESLSFYKEDRELFESAFVVNTMFSNGNEYFNNDINPNYEYYRSFIESGNYVKLDIEGHSSEFFLFMPDDLNREDILSMTGDLAKLSYAYQDVFSPSAFDNYVNFKDYSENRDKTKDYIEKFVREHDKDHRMLYNLDIGGETFESELERCQKENVEPTIQHRFTNIDKALKEDNIPYDDHDFTAFYQRRKSDIRDITSGEINFKKFSQSMYTSKEKTFRTNRVNEAISVIHFAKSVNNQNAKELMIGLKDLLLKEGITEKYISDISELLDNSYPHQYVDKVDNKGIHFKENTPKEYISLYNLKSTRFEKMADLEQKTKDTNFKDNMTEQLNIAKIAKERNMKRGFFSQIFSSDAWKERRIINNVRNEATKNGFSKDEFNSLLLKDDKEFNKITMDKNSNNIKPVKHESNKIALDIREFDEDVNIKENQKFVEATRTIEKDINKDGIVDIDINEL